MPQHTRTADVMPTLLEIAKTDIPDSVDGKSFLALAQSPKEAPPLRTWLHGEHSTGKHPINGLKVRNENTWHTQSGTEQYFQYKEHPQELCNEIHNPVYQEQDPILKNPFDQLPKRRPEGSSKPGRLIPGRYLADFSFPHCPRHKHIRISAF